MFAGTPAMLEMPTSVMPKGVEHSTSNRPEPGDTQRSASSCHCAGRGLSCEHHGNRPDRRGEYACRRILPLRAGLKPRCLDYFVDRDLMAICTVDRVEAQVGVAGLERLALGLPPGPWLYTGPLENHPDRIERISRTHRLHGNAAETLRGARDPFRLVEVLRGQGLPCLETRPDAQRLPRDGSWLVKPIASAGDRLVQHLDHATVALAEPSYLQ